MPLCNPQVLVSNPSQGPVVQSIVSLMSLLKGFRTLLLNTLIFFVEKVREAFANLSKWVNLKRKNGVTSYSSTF